MAKNLIIVESPTKTKTIRKVLGNDYRVMASVGHLRDLPKSKLGVDIENGFEPHYINVRGKGPIINDLKKAAKQADNLYLATDPDREGEAIAWHLSHILGLDPEEANRVTFHEITPNAVKEGMKNPRKIDLALVDAQQARRIMDRIMGYKISPILWKRVKGGLSAGRVQSVAVKLICDREEEIENFVPEEYWSLTAHLNKDKINFEAKYYGVQKNKKKQKVDLKTEEDTKAVMEALDPKHFEVVDVKKRSKRRNPYPPFTTSTLQQEASRRINFSTSKTMNIAQQLYEGIPLGSGGTTGLISYMRTDSTRLSSVIIGEALSYIEKEFGKEYASKGNPYSGKKANQQDAHEGIRPSSMFRTPQSIREYLTDDQYKLYNLIWKRTLASQMKPSRYLSTTVLFENNKQLFRSNGNVLQFDGFTKVWGIQDTQVLLPALEEGEVLESKNIKPEQHFTKPPARFTEASLVQTLEKNGIGRPSTYATIIRSILKRNYVELQKKSFVPTEIGKTVNQLLVQNFGDMINEEFTAKMEQELDRIAEREVEWKDVLDEFYDILKEDLENVKEDDTSYRIKDVKTGEKCPECGRDLVIKHGRNGKFIGCSGFPECTYTKSIVKKVGAKCPKCGGNIIEKVSKRGKIFYSCDNYPKCDYATWDKPTGENCPKCGDLLVHRKNRREDRILCANEDCDYEKK